MRPAAVLHPRSLIAARAAVRDAVHVSDWFDCEARKLGYPNFDALLKAHGVDVEELA